MGSGNSTSKKKTGGHRRKKKKLQTLATFLEEVEEAEWQRRGWQERHLGQRVVTVAVGGNEQDTSSSDDEESDGGIMEVEDLTPDLVRTFTRGITELLEVVEGGSDIDIHNPRKAARDEPLSPKITAYKVHVVRQSQERRASLDDWNRELVPIAEDESQEHDDCSDESFSCKLEYSTRAPELITNVMTLVAQELEPEGSDGRSSEGAFTYNGFKALPEPEVLCCREENIAPFSMPSEALTYEPAQSTAVVRFKNGEAERKIYNNIELQRDELEKLAELQAAARAKDVAFYEVVAAAAGRCLGRARMNVRKALKCMEGTQAWRREYFRNGPITDDSVEDALAKGLVYFVGRDLALRPLLVVRAARIPPEWFQEDETDQLIRVLVFCMEYFLRYMVVPGRVENLSVLVDLKGLRLTQVPLSILKEVIKVLSGHYYGRIFKFYICNLSLALQVISGMVQAMLTDRQLQKLQVLTDTKALRKDFALHQLEKDLGGLRPPVTRFWPFPLNAGPFDANSVKEPNKGAVPGMHRALSRTGMIGHSWDPKKTHEENKRLDYTVEAASIVSPSHSNAEGSEILSFGRASFDAASILTPRRDASGILPRRRFTAF